MPSLAATATAAPPDEIHELDVAPSSADLSLEQADPGAPAEPRSWNGRIVAGRYKIERLIARGGMAVVHQAIELGLERRVALKVLAPPPEDDSENFRERFRLEARTLAAMNHPNIVTCYDFGELRDGSCYLAMELVSGPRLTDLTQAGPMNPLRTVRLMLQVCAALYYAHKQGVIHRDLKTSNLLITEDAEGTEVVKVVDFGLVKVQEFDQSLTRDGVVVGSPHCMSPEQIRGNQEVDCRTDIYALGVILFRCLTGIFPFHGANATATMIAHLEEPIPAFFRAAPGVVVAPELEFVVRRCLAKAPEERYPDVRSLAADLRSCIGDKPVNTLSIPANTRPGRPPSPARAPSGQLIDDCGPTLTPGPSILSVQAQVETPSQIQHANWWRRLMAYLQGRGGLPGTDESTMPTGQWPRGPTPVVVEPGSSAVARPIARPVEDDAPPTGIPFDTLPPWEGAEPLVDSDLGPTRTRLVDRLYVLREDAPSRNDWRFLDRVIQSCVSPKLDFPLFPDGALRLDRLLRSGDPPRAKVVEVIRQEPGLVQRVWREGRSVAAGGHGATSLDEAIIRIGQRRLWEIGMAASMNSAVFRVRQYQSKADQLRAVSIVAAEVSHVFHRNGDVYLPAMLHALGKLVVYRCGVGRGKDDTASPDFVSYVADRLYPSIGVLVAEAWELGPAVAAGIGFAPAPATAPPEFKDVARATRASSIAAHEAWAARQGRTYEGYGALRALGYPTDVAQRALRDADAAWGRVPDLPARS